MALNRYLVFVWNEYDAAGGWGDFVGSLLTKEEAIELIEKKIKEAPLIGYMGGLTTHGFSFHIIDSSTQKIIYERED